MSNYHLDIWLTSSSSGSSCPDPEFSGAAEDEDDELFPSCSEVNCKVESIRAR
jgi:hypothetical protein